VIAKADYAALYALFGYDTAVDADYVAYTGSALAAGTSLAVKLFADNARVANILGLGATALKKYGTPEQVTRALTRAVYEAVAAPGAGSAALSSGLGTILKAARTQLMAPSALPASVNGRRRLLGEEEDFAALLNMVAAVLQTVNQMLDAAVASGKTGADVLQQMTAMASTVQVSFLARVVAVAQAMAAAELPGAAPYNVAAAVNDVASNFSPEAIQAAVNAFLPPPPSPPPAKGGEKRSPVAYIAAGAGGVVLSAAAAAIYVRRRRAISPLTVHEGEPPSKKQRGSGTPMRLRSQRPRSPASCVSITAVTPPEGTSPKRAGAAAPAPIVCWLPMPPFNKVAAGSGSSTARGEAPRRSAEIAAPPARWAEIAEPPRRAALRVDAAGVRGGSGLVSPSNRARAALERSRSAKRERPPSLNESSPTSSPPSSTIAGTPPSGSLAWLALPMLPDTRVRASVRSHALLCAEAVRRALGDLPALPAPTAVARRQAVEAEEVELRFASDSE